ncbi:MAG: response regulator [Xanthobacteraceae bacterium]|jgi:two-component system, response regulator PdtaR
MDSGAQATVLVVEDEELARLIITDYLREGGFAVLQSANAEQALAVLEQRGDVRAVVLDVVMPGAMDGIALAHLIHERWPGIGLLVMSGKGVPKMVQLPPGAGFLPKPYFGPSIVGRLRAIISTDKETR